MLNAPRLSPLPMGTATRFAQSVPRLALCLVLVAICWYGGRASGASRAGRTLGTGSPQGNDPTRLDSTMMRYDLGNPFSAALPNGAVPIAVAPFYNDTRYPGLVTRGGDVADMVGHFYVTVAAASGYHVAADAVYLGVTHVTDDNGFPLLLFELPNCTWAAWPCGY